MFAFSASASWESAESLHFRVYYQAGTTEPASILQIAEDFYAEMARLTRRTPAGVIDIWVCDTQKAFQLPFTPRFRIGQLGVLFR